MNNKDVFSVETPLGTTVTCSTSTWYGHITTPGKHEDMRSQKGIVKSTLEDPNKIFESTTSGRYVYFKDKSTSIGGNILYTKVVTERTGDDKEEVITAFTSKKMSGGIKNEIYSRQV